MSHRDLWRELGTAVVQRKFDTAEALLKAHPHLRSLGTEKMKETVLHYLAVENDLEGVAWLHKHGFDINTCNHFGTPVVFEVAQLGYKDLFLWFLEQDVDISARDPQNGSIIEYLEQYHKHKMIEFLKEKVPDIQ